VCQIPCFARVWKKSTICWQTRRAASLIDGVK
jgi:hypothetical protein